MAEPFLGELRLMSFNFAPKGWALCNGQFLPINQNQALFSLLGTMYGGNGQTTFALPDLRGRVPMHVGNGHTQGERSGAESVTINIQQLPTHLHVLQASTQAATVGLGPNGNMLATARAPAFKEPQGASLTTLSPQAVSSVGGSQPHNNMQPYLALNFCIALQGIFPSRN
jgi:microcystin-dependent protein